ncbi:MAG TPA: hypothetical protein H9874_00210 [Candidatus Bilophila faecipullorum]|uniref:Uncharacterized protein n=1 Tax=Candidatus Bilophila faecipullorum TaxID=2838482 RepID=A0A9D1QZX1_9BACT|nr:hypothetical protein [uncultured Bilophila sp.]HIW77557.1 hypothetical protein [Candidatus Bilophila faecipullorum]
MTTRPFRLFCLALALCYGLCFCGGAFEAMADVIAGEGGRAVSTMGPQPTASDENSRAHRAVPALGPQLPDAHISPDDPSLCSLGPVPSGKTAASWGCLFPLLLFLLCPPYASFPGGLPRRVHLTRRRGFRGLLPLPAAPPRA